MPRIYSTADRVLLWLGVAGEGSDFVMEMLLEAEAQKFNSHIMEVLITFSVWNPGIFFLLTRTYWDRVWVVQEIAYAKDVLLLCGLYQIAYSSLLKFLDILNTSGLSIIARIVARDKEPRYMLYPSSNSGPNSLLRPGWLQTQDHLPVDQLLCKFSSKACSDPRDKIFGFWGLFSPEMQHLVPVDYSKSIPEVYRSTTEAIIKTTRRMDVICWPRYKSTTQIVEPGSWESDLPSWTPNWNRRHIGVSLALHPLHQHFNACSSHSAFYRFLDNGRTLQTRGICLGNILHMQQRTVIDHNRSLPLDPDLNLLWSYVNSCRDYLKASFDSIEGDALLSTLSAGLFYSILDIDSTTRINIHRFFTSTRGYLSNTFGNDSFRVYDILLYYMYGILSGRELFSFSSKKDQERLQGYAISKAIPTLKIGLAPNNAQEGDKVCVLVGNKTPVILRQQGNHHIILGDAYVHGFMHGEAMINVDVGLEQLAEFFIH
jgi:hypothetical protein